jgi:hypothetical protein
MRWGITPSLPMASMYRRGSRVSRKDPRGQGVYSLHKQGLQAVEDYHHVDHLTHGGLSGCACHLLCGPGGGASAAPSLLFVHARTFSTYWGCFR